MIIRVKASHTEGCAPGYYRSAPYSLPGWLYSLHFTHYSLHFHMRPQRRLVYICLSPARLKPGGLLIVLRENIWEYAHKDFRSMQATRAIAPTLMVWLSVFVYRNPIAKHRVMQMRQSYSTFKNTTPILQDPAYKSSDPRPSPSR